MVGSSFRGHGIGRALMEYIIGFARQKPVSVDLNLTSKRKGRRQMKCIGSWGLRGWSDYVG